MSAGAGRRTLLAAGGALALNAAATRRGAAQSRKVINFWDMIWGPPEYMEAAKALVAQFNAEHPGLEVRYRSVPWANWYQTFSTAIGAGVAPDISTGGAFQAMQFYDDGQILPIDDVIEAWRASGTLDDFFPGTIDKLRFKGAQVALPWIMDVRVWFYRKDLCAAAGVLPPTNWVDFLSAGKALSRDGAYGVVGSGDVIGGLHSVLTLLINNGGGFFDDQAKLAFDTPRNRETIGFFSALAREGVMHPGSAGFTSDQRRAAFMQGRGAITLDSPGFADAAPPGLREKIGLLPPPVAAHGSQGSIFWVGNIMIYKQTKYPDETKMFLKWLSEHQTPLWTHGAMRPLPPRRSIASDPYFTGNPYRAASISQYIPVGRTTGALSTSLFPKLNALEGDAAVPTLAQQIMQGKDPDAAFAQANAALQQLLLNG